MNVVARLRVTRLGIGAKHGFKFFEQIGGGAEMAEMIIATHRFLDHREAHAVAVVAMKCIALDERGADLLTAENMLEGSPHGGRPGARRTRDRDDGVFCRHRVPVRTA